ncbi:TPA: DUF551 domain-containing protein [Salmonella enterica subsp. enterica serovar Orientalis]|nr:DUF551 domain-containing protein [Salmonella enterica]EBQ9233595.1 DUF551 domain-containing protein [Salmonella enterica subsp. enterica serovar Orientalis]EDV4881346.1 DUF551 domain-containing protein [Salmonella enterica subsp. enterica]EEK9235907.1 DUF551 domain-containing protein [Salmonella enterica]EHI4565093.1 DUF551 domain-containing protein [Salmonella enterica]
MQVHYSDPADRARQVIYIAAESLLDELEAAEKTSAARLEAIDRTHKMFQRERDRADAADRRVTEQSAIVAAAEKLVRCKGRYHSELNYRALAKLFGVITPDLPPLEHENVHYADAAEVEITALRQRIAELEAEPVSQTYKLNELSGNSQVTPDGWINCSERMPAQNDWVLIYSKYGEYLAGQVQGKYVELNDGTLSWLGAALHWMPLPEPPQEVK